LKYSWHSARGAVQRALGERVAARQEDAPLSRRHASVLPQTRGFPELDENCGPGRPAGLTLGGEGGPGDHAPALRLLRPDRTFLG
jgi:hypothetical protein